MRCIDADKLCEALKSMASVQYPDKQNTILGVVSSIENFPTADVVPKSEVDLYRKQVDELEDELASTYDKLEATIEGQETLQKDFALANAMRKATLLDAIDTFRNLLCIESWLDYEDERKHYVVSVDDVNRIHAELKKKYTEGT